MQIESKIKKACLIVLPRCSLSYVKIMQRYNNVFDCYDIIMEKCIRHVVLSLVIDGRSSGVKASTTMQI